MYKQNYEANGRTDTEPFLESTRGERFYQREEKNRAIFQVLQPVFVVFPWLNTFFGKVFSSLRCALFQISIIRKERRGRHTLAPMSFKPAMGGRTEDWWKRLQLWSHYSTSERSWKSGRTGTQQRAKPCQRLLIGQTSFLLVYFAFSFVNAFAQNIRPGIERSPANACVLHSFRNFLYGKSEQLLNWLAIIFSPSFLIIIMPRKIGLATRVSWFVIPQLVSFSSTGYVSVFEPFSCRCETS